MNLLLVQFNSDNNEQLAFYSESTRVALTTPFCTHSDVDPDITLTKPAYAGYGIKRVVNLDLVLDPRWLLSKFLSTRYQLAVYPIFSPIIDTPQRAKSCIFVTLLCLGRFLSSLTMACKQFGK